MPYEPDLFKVADYKAGSQRDFLKRFCRVPFLFVLFFKIICVVYSFVYSHHIFPYSITWLTQQVTDPVEKRMEIGEQVAI